MASKVQIVIDIPAEEYNLIRLKQEVDIGGVMSEAEKYIAKGILLPKGHGRLIDADKTIHYLKYDEQFEQFIDEESTIGEYISMYSDEGEPEIIIEADEEADYGK